MCKKYVPETWKELVILILKTFVFTSPEHVNTVIPAFYQLSQNQVQFLNVQVFLVLF